MGRWVVVGYYHKLGKPWGTYWGPASEMSAMDALKVSIHHAHENWSAEEQITVCAVVAGEGGLIHNFGLVRSDDPLTWPKEILKAS